MYDRGFPPRYRRAMPYLMTNAVPAGTDGPAAVPGTALMTVLRTPTSLERSVPVVSVSEMSSHSTAGMWPVHAATTASSQVAMSAVTMGPPA